MMETNYFKRKYPRIKDENEYLERKYPERGRILKRGITSGHLPEVRGDSFKIFLGYGVALLLCFFLIFLDLTVGLQKYPYLPEHYALIGILPLLLLSIAVLVSYHPKTWDDKCPVIYENGFSVITGYVSFSNVDMIGYGFSIDGGRFIRVIVKDKDWKSSILVREREYLNDFFDCLIDSLKKESQGVLWINYNFSELHQLLKTEKKKRGNKVSYLSLLKSHYKGQSGPDTEWERFVDEKLIASRNRFWMSVR